MRSHWSEPSLWSHLAGLAAIPVLALASLFGLGLVGNHVSPLVVGVLLVIFGGLPLLWLQWVRPFSLFSLLFFTLKPGAHSDRQRRLLHLQRSGVARIGSALAVIMLGVGLWKLLYLVPIASSLLRTLEWPWFTGLVIALTSFLLINFLSQNAVSAIVMLTTSDDNIAALAPYSDEAIKRDFSRLGWAVSHLPLTPRSLPPVAAVPSPSAVVSEAPRSGPPVAEQLPINSGENPAAIESEATIDEVDPQEAIADGLTAEDQDEQT